MHNSNQKYKYIKDNKHSINKMNITSTSKKSTKNIFLFNESQEISNNQYSPIMQSRKLKKDLIITLTKKTNCNNNFPNKISSNPKYPNKNKKNNGKKKNQIDKNKKELKNVSNDNNGSLPKDFERVHKEKSKKSGDRKKIKSFYKKLNFNPDINSDEITKKCIIKTSRNTDKNYIKILNAEDSEKVGISKNSKKKNNISANKISKERELKNKDSTLIDDEVNPEIENITEADENNRKIVNFPNLSKNPFLKEKSNLGKSSNSIIKTSIGTNLNSTVNESNRISIEMANTIKIISNMSQENQTQTLNSKTNELCLYDSLLYFSKSSDYNKFMEAYKQILQLPKELINLNYQDEKGYGAIHYASEEGNQKIVEFLIKEKCDINLRTKEYKTALHLSAIKGNYDICKLLIENNAEINAYDSDKNSPLHYACLYNYLNITKYILEKKPDIEARNNEGKKPNDLAKNKEIISLFNNYFKKNSQKKITPKIRKYKLIKELQKQDSNSDDNDKKNSREKIKLDNNIHINCFEGKTKKFVKEIKLIEISGKYTKIDNNKLLEKNKNKCDSKKKESNSFKKNKFKKIKNKSRYSQQNKSYMSNSSHYFNHNKSNYLDFSIRTNKISHFENSSKNNISLNRNIDLSQKSRKKFVKRKKNIPLNSKTLDNNLSEGKKINKKNLLTHNTTNDKIKIISCKTVKIDKDTNNNNKSKEKLKTKTKDNYDLKEIINHSQIKDRLSIQSNKKYFSSKKIYKIKVNNNLINYEEINEPKSYSTKGLIKIIKKAKSINQFHSNNTSIVLDKSMNIKKPKTFAEKKINLSNFVSLGILGRGSFGEVYLVEKIDTKKKYAMKVLNKDRILSQNLIKYVRAERNVLSITNHPFIVKLYFAFQTMNRLFLILEYCPGGDLSKHLFFEKKFCESRAKFYICEVLLALENLHKRNIIFRDLKPDNVVLDEEGHCKLTDFGLSKEGVSDFQSAKSFCGSIAYLAPEMIKKQGHGKSVDWYLLGVLFYEMIVGITPYFSNNKDQIFYNIENAELRIPQFVSKDAANLLKKLLEKNPLKRIGGSDKDAEEIKEDPYFKDINWDDVYNKKTEPPTINNYSIRAINYFKKPKKFINNDNDKNNLKSNFLEEWSFVDESEV